MEATIFILRFIIRLLGLVLLAQNHAFVDGNKRIAAHCILVFLALNGIEIKCTELELFSLFYELAASRLTFEELVDWIKNHEALSL